MSGSKFASFSLLVLGLLGSLLLSCLDTSADLTLVDGDKVMQHVDNIVSNGPHPAGSDAQKKVAQYLAQQITSLGLEVQTHTFRPTTPQGRLEMNNVWTPPATEPSFWTPRPRWWLLRLRWWLWTR